ncbi:MAG TPA: hypothetical protein VHN36_08250 [Ilumatobacteraceae bacterium]|nr:hypothetical protein [Ilumatobacteraceae bacterium]
MPTILELRHVSVAVGMSRSFGLLSVVPGALVFDPEGIFNTVSNAIVAFEKSARIVHRTKELTVVFGRLLPPWMNSGIVLVDEGDLRTTGVVLLAAWQRRAVVKAAQVAGLEVRVYPTWFSAAGQIGSAAELRRFRREHEDSGSRTTPEGSISRTHPRECAIVNRECGRFP